MNELSILYINKNATLKDALSQLDKTAQGVLLLVNENGEFIQTITDGDIRRMLLKNHPLNTKLEELPSHRSTILSVSSTVQEAYHLMQEYELDHIPLLNEEQKPVRLIQRKDLLPHILLSTPHMGEYEQKYIKEAFDSNWVAPLGPNVDAFEQEVAEYLNIKSAVALSSGTAAIHLALILLNVQQGDTVFVSSFTFVASANPVLYQGATPVFIDSDLDTWNMSPVALERALREAKDNNRLPKAVIIVNLYGQSANYAVLGDICRHYDIPIIEDAAESLGAKYKGQYSGTFGKIGVFSFNGNKIITTSGGGMLVSQDAVLMEKARFLSTQARDASSHYEHSSVGYNYRMSNVLAGIGRGQLLVLDQRVESRRKIFFQYQEAFKSYPFVRMMPEIKDGYSTNWLSCILIDPSCSSLKPHLLIENLKKYNIEARRTWKPMHKQPLYSNSKYYAHSERFSVSDYLFEQGLCLPSGSNLSAKEIHRVIDCLNDLFATVSVSR